MFASEHFVHWRLCLLICFREFFMTSEEECCFTCLGWIIEGNRLAYLVTTTGILTKDGITACKYNY